MSRWPWVYQLRDVEYPIHDYAGQASSSTECGMNAVNNLSILLGWDVAVTKTNRKDIMRHANISEHKEFVANGRLQCPTLTVATIRKVVREKFLGNIKIGRKKTAVDSYTWLSKHPGYYLVLFAPAGLDTGHYALVNTLSQVTMMIDPSERPKGSPKASPIRFSRRTWSKLKNPDIPPEMYLVSIKPAFKERLDSGEFKIKAQLIRELARPRRPRVTMTEEDGVFEAYRGRSRTGRLWLDNLTVREWTGQDSIYLLLHLEEYLHANRCEGNDDEAMLSVPLGHLEQDQINTLRKLDYRRKDRLTFIKPMRLMCTMKPFGLYRIAHARE